MFKGVEILVIIMIGDLFWLLSALFFCLFLVKYLNNEKDKKESVVDC